MRIAVNEIESKLQDLLQETDPSRTLDSLEIVIVQSFVCNHFAANADDMPVIDTIKGWCKWAERSL